MTNSPIQALYLAFFQRPADAAGLAYWNGVYASNGGNMAAIAGSFANSTEFGGLIAGKPLGDVIDALYTGLFGRAADPAGLQYWRSQISVGTASYASVGLAILSGVQSQDQVAINNRTNVADQFTATVSAGNATYDGLKDTAAARNFMKTVTADSNTVYNASQITTFVQTSIADPGDQLYVVPSTPPPAGQAFTLTAGTDAVVGGDGNDSVIGNGAGFFATPDSINGGAGTDALTVTDSTTITTVGTTVTNVEVASLTSTGGSVIANTTGWTGLSQLGLTSNVGSIAATAASSTAVTAVAPALGALPLAIDGGSSVTVTSTATTGTVTVGATTAPTGAILVSNKSTSAVSMGAIAVTGGTTVNVAQNAASLQNTNINNTTVLGAVTVNGKAGTTDVTVTNTRAFTFVGLIPGVTANTITINDVNNASTTLAGTITSASLSSFTTATVNDNALTTLSVKGGSGNITIGNGNLNAPTNKTLGVTINGETGGSLIDSGVYTTLNLATTGADSTLANISMNKVATLNVSGTNLQSLTSTAGMGALKTVTVSGSAGLKADLSTPGTVTSVDASATSGANTITVSGSNATYLGGSGVDKLTLTTGASKAMSLGNGDDQLTLGALMPSATMDGGNGTDTVSMDATLAQTASGSGTFASKMVSFERLTLTGSTNQTVDLAVLGNYSYVTANGGNGLTLSNMPSGGTLVLDGAGTAYTVSNPAFTAGPNDVINLQLANATGAAVGFASFGVTANNVESINITMVDTRATPSISSGVSLTLLGDFSKTITVSGTMALALTATSTALTSVDASGISAGNFVWVTGALAGAATIKGSATGGDSIFAAAATAAVTIIETAGTNFIIGSGTVGSSLTGGSGVDTITDGNGADTLTGRGGIDVFKFTLNSSRLANLDTITDYRAAGGANAGALDTIDLTSVVAVASNIGTVQNFSLQVSLAAALDVMANAAVTSNGLSVFLWGGNTYVYIETTGATTSYQAADTVIKLTGTPFTAGTSIAGLGIDSV